MEHLKENSGLSGSTPPFFPPRQEMFRDLSELGLAASKEALDKMSVFSRMLMKRSERTNLIGPRERERLWRRHFLESASFSLLLERPGPLVDIGSGNGFPGMVLALLGFETILLEPRRKRYLFLMSAAGELGLHNCRVVPQRLEDYGNPDGADMFTARSVAPPPVLIDALESIGARGSILVMRRPCLEEEPDHERFLEMKVPPLDRGGFLVQYRV